MSFSRREASRGDRQVDILTDEANGIRITVSRLGAELVSLARRNRAGEWVGFLYRDDDLSQPDKGWANHATVMGYFLHRLKDGRSLYRGHLIESGTHGFLRRVVWHSSDPDDVRVILHSTGEQLGVMKRADAVRKAQSLGLDLVDVAPTAKPPVCKIVALEKFRDYGSRQDKGADSLGVRPENDENADALIYRVGPGDYEPKDYPLKVSLELTYRLERGGLTVEFHFTSHEPDLPAHVSFGLHPGFGSTAFESFEFDMPAGKYRRYFSPQNFLSGETQDIEFGGGAMPFDRQQLPGSYILELVDVPRREFVFRDPPSGRELTLDLTGVPYLTLWSDGGPFLCVEPCWGLTDRHEQRAFEEKDGIQKIAPGGELFSKFTMMPKLSTAG